MSSYYLTKDVCGIGAIFIEDMYVKPFNTPFPVLISGDSYLNAVALMVVILLLLNNRVNA